MKKILSFCFAAATCSFAVLNLPNAQPKVDAAYWNAALDSTWQGLVRRNIEPYSAGAGLIHRPKSETPGDAVSEAVGYGMLVSLFANDQKNFNGIWEAANKSMWGRCYYNWQMSPTGSIVGTGAATDAEEDVALSLIFADKLVQAGIWQPFTSEKFGYGYAEHAQKILDCMWSTKQFTSSGILAPGAGWGGDDFVNPGYFSPAWYKIFANFDQNNSSRWNMAVNKSYEIIENSPGYSMGMVPDWMQPGGNWAGSLGYNAYFNSRAFFKDAIRILWRVAIDAVWFNEPRAQQFLTNALNFINSKGGAPASNFYQIENPGELLPADDIWTDFNDKNNLDTWRYRREHSHLTIGMWATAALAVGTAEDRKNFSKELGKFYEGKDYFGLSVDPTGGIEDTLHNEMYFDQFLAWFGASMMSGAFVNVIDAIDNPKENLPGDFSDLSSAGFMAPKAKKAAIPFEILQTNHSVIFASTKKISWSIFDTKGNLVKATTSKNFVWENPNKGFYIIKVQQNSQSITQKIIVK